jgi:uncharacterized damage-inducible protein DinB
MEDLFLGFSTEKLKQLESRIQDCLKRLSDEEVWWRGSDESNTVGNLVLHLCGNVRQWILSGVGGEEDTRQRDLEFAQRTGLLTREDLSDLLSNTMRRAVEVIGTVPAEKLRSRERFGVQGYETSVLEAIYHVVEHFSMHTGQIIYITKLLRNQDLGFYKHLNRPTHGEQTP